ncbi:hypothetical protein KR038_005830 [Drosophila bunnanda]|nr:hypothetical protein KR038_005830 [Drosophila bunnanda]
MLLMNHKSQKLEATEVATDYPIRQSFGELSTVVNIDVFDDQLSMSSISTNSRLSLEGPPSQSSPPLSLTNGGGGGVLMDTNLMHFSESAGTATAGLAAANRQPFEVDVDLDGEDDDGDGDDDEDEDEEERGRLRQRDRAEIRLGRRNL